MLAKGGSGDPRLGNLPPVPRVTPAPLSPSNSVPSTVNFRPMFGLFKHKSKETIEEYREAGREPRRLHADAGQRRGSVRSGPALGPALRRQSQDRRAADRATAISVSRRRSTAAATSSMSAMPKGVSARRRRCSPTSSSPRPSGGPTPSAAASGSRRSPPNLAQLHTSKFRRSLPHDREPMYTIMPDPGSSRIRFSLPVRLRRLRAGPGRRACSARSR